MSRVPTGIKSFLTSADRVWASVSDFVGRPPPPSSTPSTKVELTIHSMKDLLTKLLQQINHEKDEVTMVAALSGRGSQQSITAECEVQVWFSMWIKVYFVFEELCHIDRIIFAGQRDMIVKMDELFKFQQRIDMIFSTSMIYIRYLRSDTAIVKKIGDGDDTAFEFTLPFGDFSKDEEELLQKLTEKPFGMVSPMIHFSVIGFLADHIEPVPHYFFH